MVHRSRNYQPISIHAPEYTACGANNGTNDVTSNNQRSDWDNDTNRKRGLKERQ